MPLNVILADDHALVRDGIKRLLEDDGNIRVVAQAGDGREAVALTLERRPDLLIVDIRMPKLNGIEAVAELRRQACKTPCLMLSMHDSEEYVLQSIESGAYGYLLKDASREEFLKAIETIIGGERYFSGDLSHILVRQIVGGGAPVASQTPTPEPVTLTKRERQVLREVMTGASNQEIAEQLGLSRRTVETHRFNMMKKLGASNQAELSRRVRELGLS